MTHYAAAFMLALIACVQVTPHDYVGQWRVVEVLHTSGVAALSETEARALVGRTVSYTEGWMSSGATRCEGVRYVEKRYTQADFVTANRIRAEEIGISSGEVLGVYVWLPSGALCEALGSVFLRRSATTLVVNYQGVYLKMTRMDGSHQ